MADLQEMDGDKKNGGIAIMRNAANTRAKSKGKRQNQKLSKTMAIILGLIVTLEVMTAGGMILNIDFHSADIVALIFAFMVLYFGVVAMLTDN